MNPISCTTVVGFVEGAELSAVFSAGEHAGSFLADTSASVHDACCHSATGGPGGLGGNLPIIYQLHRTGHQRAKFTLAIEIISVVRGKEPEAGDWECVVLAQLIRICLHKARPVINKRPDCVVVVLP